MKKKLLFSLFGMLVVAFFAYAATTNIPDDISGADFAAWYKAHSASDYVAKATDLDDANAAKALWATKTAEVTSSTWGSSGEWLSEVLCAIDDVAKLDDTTTKLDDVKNGIQGIVNDALAAKNAADDAVKARLAGYLKWGYLEAPGLVSKGFTKEDALTAIADLKLGQTEEWDAADLDFDEYPYAALIAKAEDLRNYYLVKEYKDANAAVVGWFNDDLTGKAENGKITKTENDKSDDILAVIDAIPALEGGASYTTSAKAVLNQLKGELETYRDELIDTEEYNALIDALEKMTGNVDGKYTLVDEDLTWDGVDPSTTDYAQLTTIKTIWDKLSNNNNEDKATWTEQAKKIDAPRYMLIQQMYTAQENMTAAIDFLNASKFYGQDPATWEATVTGTTVETNDYLALMAEKAALAEDAEEPLVGREYIIDFYKMEQLEASKEEGVKTLYDLTVEAYKAYDLNEYAKEEADKFASSELFATILAEGYTVTKADYVATENGSTTVRDAINYYNNLYKVTGEDVTTNYTAKTAYSNTLESWTLSADDMKTVGQKAQALLGDTYNNTLKNLIKGAAELDVLDYIMTEFKRIYGEEYIDPSKDTYTAASVLALKNDKEGTADAVTLAGNVGGKDGNPEFYVVNYNWDDENDSYTTTDKAEVKNTYVPYNGKTAYNRSFGAYVVIEKFRKDNERNEKLADLEAMEAAAEFLDTYKSIIWKEVTTGEGEEASTTEVLITSESDITNALAEVARNAETAYGELTEKAQAYIAPIWNQISTNIELAKGDDVVWGTAQIYLWDPNKEGFKHSKEDFEQLDKINYTSKKAIKSLLNEKPNSILYVNTQNGSSEFNNNLPKTNVAVYNYENGRYEAEDIVLTYQENYWTPITEPTFVKTIKMSRKFTKVQENPLLLPFEVKVSDIDSKLKVSYLDNVYEYENVEIVTDDDKTVTGTKVEMNYKTKLSGDILYANMPYIVQVKNEADLGTYDFKAENVTLATTNNIMTDGVFVIGDKTQDQVVAQSTAHKYTLAGTTLAGTLKKGDYYLNGGRWKFFEEDYTQLKAGSIVLNISDAGNINYVIVNKFDFEDDVTAIKNVNTENTVDGIYTINGMKVNNMSKPGLYIVNGKKVLKK